MGATSLKSHPRTRVQISSGSKARSRESPRETSKDLETNKSTMNSEFLQGLTMTALTTARLGYLDQKTSMTKCSMTSSGTTQEDTAPEEIRTVLMDTWREPRKTASMIILTTKTKGLGSSEKPATPIFSSLESSNLRFNLKKV